MRGGYGMWQPLGTGRFHVERSLTAAHPGRRALKALRPTAEALEARRLLAASLTPVADLSVPAQLGYQVVLDGSGNTSPTQTYTVSSDNPDIQVSVAQGPYWTLSVSHQA